MTISSVSQIYNGLISNTNASTSKISAKSIESQQQDLLDKLSVGILAHRDQSFWSIVTADSGVS